MVLPTKAQSTVNALSGQQQKRLREYSNSLRRDRNEYLFDSGMLEVMLHEFKDESYIHRVRNHLRDINYSNSKKEAFQLRNQLDRFMEDNHRNGSTNPNFVEASRILRRSLSRNGKVRMMRYGSKDHADSLSRTNTHSGFCYILTGKREKGEYDATELQQMYDQAVVQAKEDGTFGRPILIAYRTQGSGGFDEFGNPTGPETRKWKTRFVSIVDFLVILAENQFANPFQEVLRQSGFYAGAYSDDQLSTRMTQGRRRHDHWLSIDYSSYDQTISDWLIYEAFDIIRDCFDDELFDEELWNVVKRDFVVKDFVNLDGSLERSRKGIPSGSRFTQIIGTIVNRLMILTYLIAKGFKKPESILMYIMGDDNIIFSDQKIDKEDLASYLSYNFGVVTHPDKCEEGTNWNPPQFLSRSWTFDGADRDDWTVITKLLYPERWRDYVTEVNGQAKLTHSDILYSYCLSFPVAMSRLMRDKGEFMARYRSEGRTGVGGRHFASGLDKMRFIENLGERIG